MDSNIGILFLCLARVFLNVNRVKAIVAALFSISAELLAISRKRLIMYASVVYA